MANFTNVHMYYYMLFDKVYMKPTAVCFVSILSYVCNNGPVQCIFIEQAFTMLKWSW